MDIIFNILGILYHVLAFVGALVVFFMLCTIFGDWHRSKIRRSDHDIDKRTHDGVE